MAVSFRDLLKPAAVDDVEAAKRRQALAEAMYQRSMTPNVPQAGGPVQAKYGVGNALVDLANSLAGAYGLKQANAGVRSAEDARAAALTDATKQLQGAVPDAEVGRTAAGRIMAAPDGQLAEPTYGESESQRRVAGAMGPGGTQALAEAVLKQNLSRSDPELLASVGLKNAQLAASQAEAAGRREDRAADRQMRMTMLQEQIAAREQAGRDAADLRRELAAMQRQTQLDVAGMRGEATADAAREKASEKQQGRLAALEATKAALVRMQATSDTLGSGGGFIEGRIPAIGPVAQDFDGAKAQLLAAIQSALRVPGIGSQSNMELQALMGALPERTQEKQIRDNQIKGIADRLQIIINRESGGGQPPDGAAPGLPPPSPTPPAGGAPAAPQGPSQPPAGTPPQGAGLTPEEKAELEALRARFGRR